MRVWICAALLAGAPLLAQNSSRFVQAELTSTIKTKTAAVGDAVHARVASATTLPNGTILARNAEIHGQVRAVDANSIAVSFDSVEVDGKSTPLAFSIRAAMMPGSEPPKETNAQAGSVIGMRGVTLQIDDSPQHASKFQSSSGKGLQLRSGLQLMLALPE